MESGRQWFHQDSNRLHILFESFSAERLWIGYSMVVFICIIERIMSFYIDKLTVHTLWSVLYRTIMYMIVTSLRLLYMLVVMYFNTGLFFLVVCSLGLSQCLIELIKYYHYHKTNPVVQYQGYKSIQKSQVDGEEETSFQHQYNIPKIIISDETQ